MFASILRPSLAIVAVTALQTAGDTQHRAPPARPAAISAASSGPQPEMWQLVILGVAAFGLTRRVDCRKFSRFTI
jgi:hypothetical protein